MSDTENQETEVVEAVEAELSIDDLFGEQVDAEAVKQAERELLLKAGTWTTLPPVGVKVYKDKTGRRMASFFAKIKLEGEKNGAIGFRASPDRRNAIDFHTKVETDKPDRAFKNYLMASRAFRVAHQRDAESAAEVFNFVRDYETRLRIMQTEGLENMVVAISGIRPEENQ